MARYIRVGKQSQRVSVDLIDRWSIFCASRGGLVGSFQKFPQPTVVCIHQHVVTSLQRMTSESSVFRLQKNERFVENRTVTAGLEGTLDDSLGHCVQR
jgi:hypothetical protein